MLLFVVLKNDYQAHSISAANILWQRTGKIYFQYHQAYWEPRAFFSSLCNGSVTVAISVKRFGKNDGSSGQLTCTSTVLISWSLNILFLTFLNCVFLA